MDNTKNSLFCEHDLNLANHLSGLLHKVLFYHEVDGLPDMILHELGHDNCFGLKKATYLVDNPDFDHLLGVAGFCKNECPYHKNDLWQNPYTFKNDMKKAQYHNDVKNFLRDSLRRRDINLNDSEDVKELGVNLGIESPNYFSWNMKHGNHGLLIFEQGNRPINTWRRNFLANIAALLSFCAI